VVIDSALLTEFERQLHDAEAEYTPALATVQRLAPRVESLRKIVEGMRGLVGTDASNEATTATDTAAVESRITANDAVSAVESASVEKFRPTYGGRASLPAVLVDVLRDGEPRSLDEIHRLVESHPAYQGRTLSRGSLTNRVGDLKENGTLEWVDRGVYRLAAPTQDRQPQGHLTALSPLVPTDLNQDAVQRAPGDGTGSTPGGST